MEFCGGGQAACMARVRWFPNLAMCINPGSAECGYEWLSVSASAWGNSDSVVLGDSSSIDGKKYHVNVNDPIRKKRKERQPDETMKMRQ